MCVNRLQEDEASGQSWSYVDISVSSIMLMFFWLILVLLED